MKKENKKYCGGWSANNSTTHAEGYWDINKYRLARAMREMCKGNTFQRSSGHWWVKNEKGEIVVEGRIKN